MVRVLLGALLLMPITAFAAPGARHVLVGSWRTEQYIPDVGAITSVVTFTANGTFCGFLDRNGKRDWTFAGTWDLAGGWLSYHYTQSDLERIAVGARDRDKLLEITAEQYQIQGFDGRVQTYTRNRGDGLDSRIPRDC